MIPRFPFSPKAEKVATKRLPFVLQYLQFRSAGLTTALAAAETGLPLRTIFRWAQDFQSHGIAGITPQWWRCGQSALKAFSVSPEIIDEVEQIAGSLGSAPRAWKAFARLPRCPWRLSVRVRKGILPRSFLKATRLQPVPASAWRGPSGRIYVHVGGRVMTTEIPRSKPNHSQPLKPPSKVRCQKPPLKRMNPPRTPATPPRR